MGRSTKLFFDIEMFNKGGFIVAGKSFFYIKKKFSFIGIEIPQLLRIGQLLGDFIINITINTRFVNHSLAVLVKRGEIYTIIKKKMV